MASDETRLIMRKLAEARKRENDLVQKYNTLASSTASALLSISKELVRVDTAARVGMYALKEVFGHQVQLEAYVSLLGERLTDEERSRFPTKEDFEKRATEWYNAVIGMMLGQVQEEQKEERARAEEALKKAAEAVKQAEDKNEQERAEAALSAAESLAGEASSGTAGPAYPEGATLFGGEGG